MAHVQKIKHYQKIVEVNLEQFNGNAVEFARSNIANAVFRHDYINKVKDASKEILNKTLNAKPLESVKIWEKAAEEACTMRNTYLTQTRKNVGDIAKAFSKNLKEEGLSFADLIRKYTEKLYEKVSYEKLSKAQQDTVMQSIVKASGRTNANVNFLSKILGATAVVLILVTATICIYKICEAENPTLEFVKIAVDLGFGYVGAVAGSALGTAIGAAGGPVGVIIGSIIGGVIGGFVASFAGNTLFNILYRVFFPSSTPGPGQPLFDVFPVLYGQPKFDVEPVVGQPELDVTPVVGLPDLAVEPVVGLPNLW